MKAIVFSDSPSRVSRLAFFSGRGASRLDSRPLKELKKALPSLEAAPLVYLDVTGISASARNRILSMIAASPRVRFCIVDPKDSLSDVAAVFHSGAVDYLGHDVVSRPAGSRRVAAVQAYARRIGAGFDEPAPASAPDLHGGIGDGWAEVEPGKEHAFALLFIEVDDAEGLKQRHEPDNLASAMATFREFIERIVSPHGGRLWMWSRFGGLVLFPLRERGPFAPQCGLRILLSSILYDCEGSPLPGRLSFRMALSTGTTVYHDGDTGRIISDAVNSIFHLGRRFTRPGQFVLTAEAQELAPSQLRPFFHPAGSYEGRRIYRLLRPSCAAGMREAVGQ